MARAATGHVTPQPYVYERGRDRNGFLSAYVPAAASYYRYTHTRARAPVILYSRSKTYTKTWWVLVGDTAVDWRRGIVIERRRAYDSIFALSVSWGRTDIVIYYL